MTDEEKEKDEINEKDGIITDKEELEKKLKQHKRDKKPISKRIKGLIMPEPPSCYLTGPSDYNLGDDDDDENEDVEVDCYLISPDEPGDDETIDDYPEDTEPMCYDMGPIDKY